MTDKKIYNNRYQYIQDALKDNQSQKQEAQAQSEIDIASKYAAEDIDADDNQKFADSHGDEGHSGLFKSMWSGIASGQKQATAKKKDDARAGAKRAREFFEEQGRELREEVSNMKLQEYAKEKMLPQVTAYLKNMNQMTPENRLIAITRMTNQSNKLLGTDYEPINVDGSVPSSVTFRSRGSGEEKTIDIGVEHGGEALQQYELMENQTTAVLKRQAEQEEKDRKAQLEYNKYNQKDKIAENQLNHQKNKFAYDSNPVKQGEAAFIKEKQKTLGSKIFEYKQIVNTTATTVGRLKNMRKLVDDNPLIFNIMERNLSKWLTINPENGIMSIKEEVARKFTNTRYINVVKELSKDYNNILYDRVNRQSVGRVTDKMLAMDQKSLPLPWEMGRESFYATVDELTQGYNEEISLYDSEIKMANDQYEGIMGGVPMVFPDGIKRFVSKENKEEAIEMGAKDE